MTLAIEPIGVVRSAFSSPEGMPIQAVASTAVGTIVTPFLDAQPRGVFATRAPTRPNRLGLSVVRLRGIANCVLDIEQVDMADGTPVVDLKPYLPAFDDRPAIRIGWFAGRLDGLASARADGRMS